MSNQDETKPYFWEDEAKRLQHLIRTEKLKLLDSLERKSMHYTRLTQERKGER